jgi:pyridoxal biosynthesis lyase PdxS
MSLADVDSMSKPSGIHEGFNSVHKHGVFMDIVTNEGSEPVTPTMK